MMGGSTAAVDQPSCVLSDDNKLVQDLGSLGPATAWYRSLPAPLIASRSATFDVLVGSSPDGRRNSAFQSSGSMTSVAHTKP
jgi:hypothetical protein